MSHKQPSATCPVVVGYGDDDDDNGSLDGDVVKQLRGNTASVDLQNLSFVVAQRNPENRRQISIEHWKRANPPFTIRN